jgi:hypothetical protein
VGRPLSARKKTNSVQVLFTDEEKRDLDWLLKLKNDELRELGVTMNPPQLIRWLIGREVEQRRKG